MKTLWLLVVLTLGLVLPQQRAWAEDKLVQIQHGGLTLNANLSLAAGKSLKDGVVLITHGTLAHNGMQIIKTLQPGLADEGVNSLAISLSYALSNRQGMYDCPTPHRHKYTDALDEIGAWLSWLKAQGADKVSLMGHSRGGAQTAWFAAERLDPVVKKVILLAPMTWNDGAVRQQYRKRFSKELDEPLAKARKMKGDEMMVADFLACPATPVSAAAFLSYYADEPRFDTPRLLSRIKAPVLVIAASDDQLIQGLPEAVKPLADGKNISLVTIPDADHFFNNFAGEDAVAAAVRFIKD